VVIWGDSYALAWAPLAQHVADRLEVPAVVIFHYGCPPLPGADLALTNPVEARNCRKWNEEALAYLADSGADTLILAGRWQKFMDADGGKSSAVALARAVAEASPLVRKVIVVGPTPELPESTEKCAALGSDCAVSRAVFEAQAAPSRLAMRQLSAPNLTVTDPTAFLCDATTCVGIRDGIALYSDAAHVSDYTARAWAETAAADWR
jgi:hypothetical protein